MNWTRVNTVLLAVAVGLLVYGFLLKPQPGRFQKVTEMGSLTDAVVMLDTATGLLCLSVDKAHPWVKGELRIVAPVVPGKPESNALYTLSSLAAQVKEKYPAYRDVDDRELIRALVAQFPVYREWIETEELQSLEIRTKPAWENLPQCADIR